MTQSPLSFYDSYHLQNKNSAYSHFISRNNFTYYWTIKQLDEVFRYFDRDKKLQILDVGCGVGTICLYLAKQGHTVTGIDISKKAIEICNFAKKASKINTANFICTSVEKMQLSSLYDLIICSEVIEHVEHDQKLINILYTKLKKKGMLLITTPSLNAPLYRWGYLHDFDQRVGHLRRYTMESLSQLLTQTGLRVLKKYKTEGLLRNSLYTFGRLGVFIKFFKGPLVPVFHMIDFLSMKVFGESDLAIIARKGGEKAK